ncbi:GntP family permease [Fulvivirga lutimaris]|uniref:GntP family permease n=1 Tax=Fulvivirga lutimaris TaxID=1819566 RepID=UPI0012BBE91F|nr:gluconate:H+ symporter [Fulvivirga lutimaris]MTI38709.1 gluconate transporter [Fulvivirga lutimaris]
MIDYTLLLAVFSGIAAILVLILFFRIHAFLALLIASILVGVIAGVEPLSIIKTMQNGMGGTLGFVAMVVGLGAIFGAILEQSGGAEALAKFLLAKFGEQRASWAMMITGFVVAIPVFFDVAFIILIPMVYALQRKTKKSLLLYALPLLTGLAITHAFIPPTPGPVAVADILGANLGWVIMMGFLAGIPAAIVGGPIFAKYIAKKIPLDAPKEVSNENIETTFPPVGMIITIIIVPILLIVANTLLNSSLVGDGSISEGVKSWIEMIGHPFSALIIANLLAWYFLGIKRGLTKETLLKISGKSMEPAGIIILLTGAGGVFKQMLVDTGAGEMLANYVAASGLPVIFFAFIAAALVRVLQGSSTVAMITAAGLISPLLASGAAEIDKALIVIAIACGASTLSHVNDSGFWLVSNYLGMTEKQTFRSWTMMTLIISLVGFAAVLVLSAAL